MTRAVLGYNAEDDQLVLICGPRDTDLAKQVPGMAYHKESKAWRAHARWGVALACRGIFGEALALDNAVTEWGYRQLARVEYAATIRAGALPADEDMSWAEGLLPFQPKGVAYLSEMEQVLLADEMGTGKTVMAARALQRISGMAGLRAEPWPALVIATNSMKDKWAMELEKWTGNVRPFVLGSTKTARAKALKAAAAAHQEYLDHGAGRYAPVVVIVNWEALRLESRLAGFGSLKLTEAQRTPGPLNTFGFQTVIADEAHKASDPKSQQTRAWWALSHAAYYRWALTGTPVNGEPEDLWAIMHGLDPYEWSGKSRYIDRYARSGLGMWGGLEVYDFDPAHLDELYQFLDPRFLRRSKAEVLPHLPPKLYDTVRVHMSAKQAKAYNALVDHAMMYDPESEHILTATNPLTLAGRLRQVASATPVLGTTMVKDEETGEEREVVTIEELVMPSCKVDAMLDIIESAGGESLIVFAESRLLIELCASQLAKAKPPISYVAIHGGVSADPAAPGLPSPRQMAVDTFQHGDAQVALVVLGAGAEGITLTAATREVFLDETGSLVRRLQAEDRAHRIGQEADRLLIIDVVAADTLEDGSTRLEEKDALLQQIVRDPARMKRYLKGEPEPAPNTEESQ